MRYVAIDFCFLLAVIKSNFKVCTVFKKNVFYK